MRVLVTGATGLIGSAISARLAADGHDVDAVVRPGSGPVPLAIGRRIALDMTRADDPAAWAPHLDGVDAVVNCAGVLQDSPRENTAGVHVAGAAVLFAACERFGPRRVVHFSAIGVDRARPSAFSATKHQGEEALKARDLDWVILRPSVVLGRNAFGASALIRGLAALPVLPLMPGTGELQVVRLDDVVATVAALVAPSAPSRVELELVGPERLQMHEVIALYRRWLGWPPARTVTLPEPVAGLLYRCGDLGGRLGWRPALRSTARREIGRGAVGDPARWSESTGIRPQSLAAALAGEPATVQDRWHARLYFLKPVVLVVLALFWIATGIVSLTAGFASGVGLMQRTEADVLAAPAVVAGALADIAIGLAIAWRPTARLGLWLAIVLSLAYMAAGSILLPALWTEPLGPLMKIWPILALHLVALAILKGR